ncbi:MAG: helix-turn-helix transcriptional regulator [Eubacterium ventriosum]|uniref:helix-turn-helix domain-containing protein n=1 Tax=Eubacterium ventriosum TaxID=39496 RepID=UPI00300ED5B1
MCADIGKRIKQRRKELNLSLGYIADKMGVNISTAQRYEAGLIDNSKKIVVDSLAEILHTTPEWLRGETSDLNSDVKDYMELKLIDSFNSVLKSFSNNLTEDASMFSKNMFLLLLNEFAEFNKSFEFALLIILIMIIVILLKLLGLVLQMSLMSYVFKRVNSTINTFTELSDILRTYAKIQLLQTTDLTLF